MNKIVEKATNIYNHSKIHLIGLTILPLVFVTKTLEIGLVLGLCYAVFYLLTRILNRVIKYKKETINIFIYAVMIAAINAVFIRLIHAFIPNLYDVLVVSGISYFGLVVFNVLTIIEFLIDDEKRFKADAMNALYILVGLMSVGLLREVLSTLNISFGAIIPLKSVVTLHQKDLSSYVLTLFSSPSGALMAFAFVIAIYQACKKKEA